MSDKLNYIVSKKNILYSFFTILIMGAILVDLTFSSRLFNENFDTYIYLLFVCLVLWFAFYFILWVQLKNPLCTEKIMDFAILFFLTISTIISIVSTISFLAGIQENNLFPLTSSCIIAIRTIQFQNKRTSLRTRK